MPQTRVNCPNCRQPVLAEIDQLFDLGTDPSAKQKLLSGAVNFIQCPTCGYQGNIAVPIVYHDPDKELLLTFVPAELGLPRNEQERLIGSLINRAVNNLPQEKRKGYLLRPQASLTMQGLIETILEADGITREMIQAQQKKISLIQRLLNASGEARDEILSQEEELIDAEFFAILSRLVEATALGGDRENAQRLMEMQDEIVSKTSFGQQLQAQSEEVQAAIASLQEAGKGLTRERLLDLIVKAPNETRVQALVSLARPAMDYQFFQLLSDRIERARGEGRSRLIDLREKLLQLTQAIDQQVESRRQAARRLLDTILNAPEPERTLVENISSVDEFFLQEFDRALNEARQKSDLERIAKLQKILAILQEVSQQPEEVSLIEDLLDADDDEARLKILDENQEKITPEFLETLTKIMSQVEASQDVELAQKIKDLHRLAVRFSMQLNLRK